MDWLPSQPQLPESYFRFFRYGNGQSTIVRRFSLEDGARNWELSSEYDVHNWLEKDYLLCDGKPSEGFCVLVCSRAPGLSCLSSPLHNLPFSRNTYEQLCQKFELNGTIPRHISRGVEIFSKNVVDDAGVFLPSIEYDARMAKSWGEDLAISAGYRSESGMTTAIIYGCSEKQRTKIVRRLSTIEDDHAHPFSIMSIFAELGRDRLLDRVDDLIDKFLHRTETLSNETRSWKQVLNSEGEKPSDLLELYNESRNLIRGLRASKSQVLKMIEHVSELQTKFSMGSGPDDGDHLVRRKKKKLSQIGSQIRDGLVDIREEYDQKIEDCQAVLEDLTVTTHIMMSYLARRETEVSTTIAAATKRDNDQMKSIALMTMIYLPVTSVASVFSMGVFNWNAGADENVLTRYFWVYVAIAGCLTITTILIWRLVTTRKANLSNDWDGVDSSV